MLLLSHEERSRYKYLVETEFYSMRRPITSSSTSSTHATAYSRQHPQRCSTDTGPTPLREPSPQLSRPMGAADVGENPRLWSYNCVSAEVVSEGLECGPESLQLVSEGLERGPESLELVSETRRCRGFVVVAAFSMTSETADTGIWLDGCE